MVFPAVLLDGCARGREAALAARLSRGRGIVELPAGAVLVHRELVVRKGARNLEIRGNPAGSTLIAAADFQGRALIVSEGAAGLRLTGFRVIGNLPTKERRSGLPVSDIPFARFYRDNGILIEGATRVSIRDVSFTRIPSYPLLVSASTGVRIEGVRIADSGSLNPSGRNNASGGILLEEGTNDFQVRHCVLERIRGNAIWTHSYYHSPRNSGGIIEDNRIEEVARDAIQVGHATDVIVRNNSGRRIGYPSELVDIASWAVPAALDTAGNVDRSVYAGNRFEDVNGKCIDLDGFHDGEVRGNSCISKKSFDDYPFAQFGIVFNNANPDSEPSNVTITGNLIDGAGYGGLYLLGSNQTISHNRFLGLNRNRCTDDRTKPRCDYSAGDPALLRSGIYLVAGAARPARTIDNRITDNQISGFGMRRWCIEAGPGVSLKANRIEGNRCLEDADRITASDRSTRRPATHSQP